VLSKRFLLAFILATIWPMSVVKAQHDHDLIKRGNELVAREQYSAAIREYERVSPTSGDDYARALYNIGVCYYELSQTDRAINLYSQAIAAANDSYPRASYALGVALEDQGRFAEAEAAYKKSIADSRGKLSPAQFRLGLLTLGRGDYTSAARLFREATKRSGEHRPSSHNNLGVVLASTGQLVQAEREFKIALQLTDGNMQIAAENLKLCRHLLAAGTTVARSGGFESSDAVDLRRSRNK
jgi:tetratricopeptide (TPR) repeat protein